VNYGKVFIFAVCHVPGPLASEKMPLMAPSVSMTTKYIFETKKDGGHGSYFP
jgi:hypothetical protein